MVDRYVSLEGVADILQLSGGEPTLHPDLVDMVQHTPYEQSILAVMINTNGIRLARDRRRCSSSSRRCDRASRSTSAVRRPGTNSTYRTPSARRGIAD